MLGLTNGELFVVLFVTFFVVSATWWPRLGAAIGRSLSSRGAVDDGPAAPRE